MAELDMQQFGQSALHQDDLVVIRWKNELKVFTRFTTSTFAIITPALPLKPVRLSATTCIHRRRARRALQVTVENKKFRNSFVCPQNINPVPFAEACWDIFLIVKWMKKCGLLAPVPLECLNPVWHHRIWSSCFFFWIALSQQHFPYFLVCIQAWKAPSRINSGKSGWALPSLLASVALFLNEKRGVLSAFFLDCTLQAWRKPGKYRTGSWDKWFEKWSRKTMSNGVK